MILWSVQNALSNSPSEGFLSLLWASTPQPSLLLLLPMEYEFQVLLQRVTDMVYCRQERLNLAGFCFTVLEGTP